MQERDRQKKVISMMITSHSILRDRYIRLSSLFENGLLAVSVILNTLIFVDAKFIEHYTSLSEDQQKLLCGLVSIIVFTISIVLLQVKWKEKVEKHSKAVEHLSKLMQELREILQITNDEEKNLRLLDFNKNYAQLSTIIAPIPDREFNRLKLKHVRKVELSKLISRHPGSILIILKVKLFLSSFKEIK